MISTALGQVQLPGEIPFQEHDCNEARCAVFSIDHRCVSGTMLVGFRSSSELSLFPRYYLAPNEPAIFSSKRFYSYPRDLLSVLVSFGTAWGKSAYLASILARPASATSFVTDRNAGCPTTPVGRCKSTFLRYISNGVCPECPRRTRCTSYLG